MENKEKIIADLRQAIKELNSLICNPVGALVYAESAVSKLNSYINGSDDKSK